MIPGRTECMPTWTEEYQGYLMSDYLGHHRTTYVCVDENAQSVPGSNTNLNGALFYFAETSCTGIKCPPYDHGTEVACVVCTK